MNHPKPKEWDAKLLSQRMIADYKPFNFVDGEGVRNSLYVRPLSSFPLDALKTK